MSGRSPQLDETICKRLQGAFILGAQRIDQQDVRFTLNQLVEIAVRALSPGTNDPFTALACIDHLGAALGRLAAREWPSPERAGAAGRTRIITEATPFAAILDATVGPIHDYGATHPLVLCRLLDALVGVAAHAIAPERQAAAPRQIEQIAERGTRLPDEIGRTQVAAHARQALQQTTTQIAGV